MGVEPASGGAGGMDGAVPAGAGGTGGMETGAGGDDAMEGAAGMHGAGGSGGMPTMPAMDGPEASIETLELVISSLGCDGACCHGAAAEITPLNLTPRGPELVASLTSTVSEKCNNLPIVDPGNPEGSALVVLMKEDCGGIARMPAGCLPGEGGGCVPDPYIEAIEQWIADGALAE